MVRERQRFRKQMTKFWKIITLSFIRNKEVFFQPIWGSKRCRWWVAKEWRSTLKASKKITAVQKGTKKDAGEKGTHSPTTDRT